ncbi:Eugenol O-methyltransferase [Sesamum alatum]|uniref:Eugenol O-methyltransferase n=1 Tax=Sesamum alatum TaxID=300844 RepID=A0AAE2CFR8_9LAMI|nr:Eugenol O-methyltransferase [Sesamum alatum]
MAFENGEVSKEQLLHAQAHVWNHLFSFINSMSLKCAIELGIPDIIHNHAKPISLSQLLDALQIPKVKSHFVYRLMRMLIHSEFFVKVSDDEEERYWLTPASCLFLRNAPLTVTPLVPLILDPIFTTPFDHLSEWLASEHNYLSPFEMAHGRKLFELAGQELRVNELLNEAMCSDARILTHVLLREHRQVLEGMKLLVDVGGGIGTTAKAIADAFPDMKCIVLDLPHVVGGLEGTNNLTYVAGDMFETIPSADTVFLKWILHDWNDEDCVKILKKCKEAIDDNCKDKLRGGCRKVMIIDMVVDVYETDNNKAMETHLLFDIAMMSYINGKERTKKEWAKLFFDAGFTSYNITPAFGLRSLIQLYP